VIKAKYMDSAEEMSYMRPSMDIIHVRDEGFVKKYLSGFIRAWTVAAILLIQVAFILFVAYCLSQYGIFVYLGVEVVSILIVCSLVNKRTDESFKIGWLVIISVLPIAGIIMYLIWGRTSSVLKIRRKHLALLDATKRCVKDDGAVLSQLKDSLPGQGGLAKLLNDEGFPVSKNNRLSYYKCGEEAFSAVFEDIKNAKEYILMSFFIVAEGALWEALKPVIIGKAKNGVKVMFLYDDFGSMFRTDKKFWKELTDAGVMVAAFNPVHKYLDKLYKNFRNHQKIVVIDGTIAYTGGFNLADEYVNAVERFGYWKDNGIRIEGDGAYHFAAIFLEMWGLTTGEAVTNVEDYRRPAGFENDTYCLAFADGPDNTESGPIPSAVRHIIYDAEKYLYITTPYLVVGDEIVNALIDASRRGVDVRIVTPAIPDKKFVFQLTRLTYGRLLGAGVKVYEYTPGFIHAKSYINEKSGLLGTVNLDFRSLYLHYECEMAFWDDRLINEVKEDIIETIGVSKEITLEDWKNRPIKDKIIQHFLALFASLL